MNNEMMYNMVLYSAFDEELAKIAAEYGMEKAAFLSKLRKAVKVRKVGRPLSAIDQEAADFYKLVSKGKTVPKVKSQAVNYGFIRQTAKPVKGVKRVL